MLHSYKTNQVSPTVSFVERNFLKGLVLIISLIVLFISFLLVISSLHSLNQNLILGLSLIILTIIACNWAITGFRAMMFYDGYMKLNFLTKQVVVYYNDILEIGLIDRSKLQKTNLSKYEFRFLLKTKFYDMELTDVETSNDKTVLKNMLKLWGRPKRDKSDEKIYFWRLIQT